MLVFLAVPGRFWNAVCFRYSLFRFSMERFMVATETLCSANFLPEIFLSVAGFQFLVEQFVSLSPSCFYHCFQLSVAQTFVCTFFFNFFLLRFAAHAETAKILKQLVTLFVIPLFLLKQFGYEVSIRDFFGWIHRERLNNRKLNAFPKIRAFCWHEKS